MGPMSPRLLPVAWRSRELLLHPRLRTAQYQPRPVMRPQRRLLLSPRQELTWPDPVVRVVQLWRLEEAQLYGPEE